MFATWHDSALAAEIATARRVTTAAPAREGGRAGAWQSAIPGGATDRTSSGSRRAEAELQRFLADQEIDSASVEAERELSTVSGSLLEAQNERRRLEGVLEQVARAGDDQSCAVDCGSPAPGIGAKSAPRDSPRESELSRRYGPRHVRMVALASEAAAAEQAYETEMLAVVAGCAQNSRLSSRTRLRCRMRYCCERSKSGHDCG